MDNKTNVKEIKEVAQVPFNMYDGLRYEYEDRLETQRKEFYEQLEKEKKDKDKSVKHWKQACIAVSIALIVFLASLFGTVGYVLYNYDFVSYEQDGNGFNNMNTGQQGDVDFGASS